MTKEEYTIQVNLTREAAKRLVKKYNFGGLACNSCKSTNDEQIKGLRSILILFKENEKLYSKFRSQSLGVDSEKNIKLTSLPASTGIVIQKRDPQFACCGFWFYACCTLCAASIEAFPVYLMCCSYCFHSECCDEEQVN